MSIARIIVLLALMSLLAFSTRGAAEQSYEAIRVPQFDSGRYAVSILLQRTDRFQDPRNAVSNELGKDIEGEPLKLLIVDSRDGTVVCLHPVWGVPGSILEDDTYGHTFANASVLELHWSAEEDEFRLSQNYMYKSLTNQGRNGSVREETGQSRPRACLAHSG